MGALQKLIKLVATESSRDVKIEALDDFSARRILLKNARAELDAYAELLSAVDRVIADRFIPDAVTWDIAILEIARARLTNG